jgi:type VI secretion system protein ImpG
VFNKYYQDELQFLRELGEEFSRAHPGAAHHLSGPGRDPDVERVLEGFAFLSAKIRQKLEDEYPELTHGLIHMLWPHYLRPVPSMAILEFSPVLAALRQSQVIPKGAQVQSVPVEGTPCRFRTAYDVVLNPISLEEVTLETRTTGASRLRLGFKIHHQARPETLKLGRVRLFLHGEPAVSYALYLHLCRHVQEARAYAGASAASSDAPFVPLALEPAGFDDGQWLVPYPPASFPGYRHLQEYFALPQKFMFVDVVGLDGLASLGIEDRFHVDVRFDRQLAATLRPSREEVRLNCTPIVNVFEQDGDPIRLTGTQTEYRIRPSGRDPFHQEIFDIERVTAYPAGSAEGRELPDFYAFSRGMIHDGTPFYFKRLRPSVVDERLDTYVSFVDPRGAEVRPDAETIAFRLTCTNRRLAEALRVGDVREPTDSTPAFVQFKNLTAPTPSVAPPLGGDLHWRLISHLSLNYVSLVNVEALRGILELYNFQAMRDPRAARANALRLEGIHAVSAQPSEALVHGCPLRGSAVTLDLLEDHFADDGDLFLFASILNEFISLYATLNSFTQLTVRGLQKGEVTSWPHRIGRDLL